MNKLIDESLSFLISEYKRLKLKEKKIKVDEVKKAGKVGKVNVNKEE